MIKLVPAAELDAEQIFAELFDEHWPEFIFHDPGVKPYVARRVEYFADLDCFLLDGDRMVGVGWGVPLRWDATAADLPARYTDALARSVDGHEAGVAADTFCVMGAVVRADEQGRGRAAEVLGALKDLAAARGWARVIAPVRPTLKHSYPLTPIEAYAGWRRPDGLPLDPWLRTHERMGAQVLAVAPRSQSMTGTVADWEKWTGLALPASGDYVIPDGLSVLRVDRAADRADYHEPNVWMRHR